MSARTAPGAGAGVGVGSGFGLGLRLRAEARRVSSGVVSVAGGALASSTGLSSSSPPPCGERDRDHRDHHERGGGEHGRTRAPTAVLRARRRAWRGSGKGRSPRAEATLPCAPSPAAPRGPPERSASSSAASAGTGKRRRSRAAVLRASRGRSAPWPALLAPNLWATHVPDRPDQLPGLRERRRVPGLRDSEVRQPEAIAVVDQDVRRLEVAMHHAGLVDVLQRGEQLLRQALDLGRGEPLAAATRCATVPPETSSIAR